MAFMRLVLWVLLLLGLPSGAAASPFTLAFSGGATQSDVGDPWHIQVGDRFTGTFSYLFIGTPVGVPIPGGGLDYDPTISQTSTTSDPYQCLQRGTLGFDQTIASIEPAVGLGIYLEWRQARYVATVASAGTYTFYINAVNPNLNNSPNPNFSFGSLTATFHPQ